MRFFVRCFVFVTVFFARSFAQPNQSVTVSAAPPAPVSGVSASWKGSPGGNSIYYWVVARYPSGWALNPTPAVAGRTTGIATLSATQFVTVNWNQVGGATGYDVIRAAGPGWPGSCSACIVALNTAGPSITDTSPVAAGGNYPPAGYFAASGASFEIRADNSSPSGAFMRAVSGGFGWRLALYSGTVTVGRAPVFDAAGNLVDGPALFPAVAHAVLGATHSDTLASAPLLGGLIFANSTPAWAQLAGNTAATRKFLRQLGTGAVSAPPAWDTLQAADVPTLNQSTTGNAATATALAADPAGCTNQFTRDINASGTASCASVAGTDFALQSANEIFAGPGAGPAAGPGFRALVSADIPANAANTSGTAAALSATLTEAMEPAHDGDVTNPAGDLTLTIAANAVTPAKASLVMRTRDITFVITGSGALGVLQDTDDQPAVWYNSLGQTATITAVSCRTDSATASRIQLQRDDGTPANILTDNAGAGLDCSSARAAGALDAAETAVANTNALDFVMVTAGGVGKWVSVTVTYTI